MAAINKILETLTSQSYRTRARVLVDIDRKVLGSTTVWRTL